jgi:hypothetical protein
MGFRKASVSVHRNFGLVQVYGYAVIRPSDPTGALVEQITFKNLIAAYGFRGWSVDGKGIYVQELTSSGMVLYAGLDGHSQVLWKHGSSPVFWFDYSIPSPTARISPSLDTYESNAWMLENF